MTATRYTCPVPKCGWFRDEPAPSADDLRGLRPAEGAVTLEDITLSLATQAIGRRTRAVEEAFVIHLAGHDAELRACRMCGSEGACPGGRPCAPPDMHRLDVDEVAWWLRGVHTRAGHVARRHRHPCGEWEFDHMVGEVRDHCNAGTVAFVGRDDPTGEHLAWHGPAAVLRRIDAERKTLTVCEAVLAGTGWKGDDARRLAESTVRRLAEGWM